MDSFNKRLQNRRQAKRISNQLEQYIEHFECINVVDLMWLIHDFGRDKLDCVVRIKIGTVVDIKQVTIPVAEEYLKRNVKVKVHIKK